MSVAPIPTRVIDNKIGIAPTLAPKYCKKDYKFVFTYGTETRNNPNIGTPTLCIAY